MHKEIDFKINDHSKLHPLQKILLSNKYEPLIDKSNYLGFSSKEDSDQPWCGSVLTEPRCEKTGLQGF